MKIQGKVWVFGGEINTDLIFPHHALGAAPEEQCRLCMSDNRPGWSEQVEKGDILIAGPNFGTGSSRPGALILKRLGLACVIAESFNGLFYRNCIGYGFAALASEGITEIFDDGDIAEIDFTSGTIRNIKTGEVRKGNVLSREMLEIIEAGGIEGVLKLKGYI